MSTVASRDLRNNTRDLLRRVEAGEAITITINGAPVATLEPVAQRPRWMSKEAFLHMVGRAQADPALADELRSLAPDTTDDLPL